MIVQMINYFLDYNDVVFGTLAVMKIIYNNQQIKIKSKFIKGAI